MMKQALLAVMAGLTLSAAEGSGWQGRVVDLGRAALAGAKVTLQPDGVTAVTDANGIYRLSKTSETASLVIGPSRPSPAGQAQAGLRLAFQAAREVPAWDLTGRRLRPVRSRWTLVAPLLPRPGAASSPPLAKGSADLFLTAEKPGYQTTRITLNAGTAIPDIVLAPGQDWSMPVSGVQTPIVVPRLSTLTLGSTSTDIPNVKVTFKVAAGVPEDSTFILKWELEADTGVGVFVRPHVYFPASPESAEATPPSASSGDSGRITMALSEMVRYGVQEPGTEEAGWDRSWGPYVSLLARKKSPGQEYGMMQWLQFYGPIPANRQVVRLGKPASGPYKAAAYSGSIPPMDTCGRLAGKVAWMGAGPRPELWIGMLGTELFTRIAPDGTFRTDDLPPGNPPLAVVRVIRKSGEVGDVVARTFHPLEGVTVVPGQTTILESILLSGE